MYSLRVFSNVLDSAGAVFIEDLTGLGNWKRSIRGNGGSWQGSITMRGTIVELADKFYTWLGYDVQERCGGTRTWGGLIYEMELSYAGVKRRRSLDLLANYVSVYYIDPVRAEHQTSWASQTQSIARYGRKEEIEWLDDMTEPAAEALRDRILAESAWPWARPLSLSSPGEAELTLVVCGYCFTANWRYTTRTTELDNEQGNLTYAATTFTDDAQDFSDWDTAAPAEAHYSLWVTNDDNTLTWAYIGDLNGGNTVIDVYTDQGLTVAGWNGAGIAGKTPSSYYVRGPAWRFISASVTNDCEYLTAGSIQGNYVQINRVLQRDQRCWDTMMNMVELGDTSGNPWRLWVTPDRYLNYKQIDTTPRYYLHDGGIYDSVGGGTAVLPWLIQPAVFRDMSFTVARNEEGSWLDDARDIYVDEVEVDAKGNVVLKTQLFSEGDLLIEQAEALKRMPMRAKREVPENV